MDHYDEILSVDKLDVPQAYRAMCAGGLFSYFGDKAYEDMTSDQRIEAMQTRALEGKLLYFRYKEWYTPIEGAGMVDGMVPFAGDGAGDQYCWYVPWADVEGRVPIVYFDHEMWTIVGLAPDYESWLFRAVLEEYTQLDCSLFSSGQIAKLVKVYVEMVRPYVSASQVELLQQTSALPVRQKGDTCVLLSEDGCDFMLRNTLAFQYLNVKVEVKPNY